MMKSNEVLSLQGVGKSFPATARGGEPIEILDSINLNLFSATSVAITGKSGSGKSTMLQISAGLLSPQRGKVLFSGQDLTALGDDKLSTIRSRSMGFIFQSSLLLDDFTALENVAVPAMIAGIPQRVAKERAKKLLESVGLGDRLDHKSDQLSGGERQRVAIARALVNDPLILFADEPTGSLDERNAELIENMLFAMVAEKEVALMLITHNKAFALRCDRVYNLHNRSLEVVQ